MDITLITLLAVGLIFVLLAIGTPVFAALALSGAFGIVMSEDLSFLLSRLKSLPFSSAANYSLTVIPLFILMGAFAHQAQVGRRLFHVANKWVGHLPGGLAMAGILTSAGFAATSGSSVATAATVGAVAIPEMKRAGYDPRLAAGSVAAGGVLGVLIPPSVLLIFYAALTEVSAGKMLIAGFVPGILTTIVFMAGTAIVSRHNIAARSPRAGWGERLRATGQAWQVLVLFAIVLGGIYLGLVTPTEAGAIGALAAFLMLVFSREGRRGLGGRLQDSFRSTTTTTVMVLFTMIGAGIFSYFLTLAQVPQAVAEAIVGSGVPPLLVVGILLLLYIPLGMFLDAFSMMVITLPIMFPTVTGLGFDPIWFGILCVKMCEIGLITPPVGLNCFVIAGIDRDTPLSDVFRGALWFIAMEMVTVLILFFIPVITTWLPDTMMGR
ncbi:TRAP transporter large permease [Sinirhodobacter ferrireducens]|uniref:TRAP transporter large permease protein n=1 Tax=Paenirhodobacter ferrireducens TaxID=1215032 RepID=A0A443LHQ8_9RHOB|nr:TRAP transporter large permease [Sinirhodobacter ferrireducens]RWR48706.1 TRAP transporter large permease [Sinirhodobacter ferrireducens]